MTLSVRFRARATLAGAVLASAALLSACGSGTSGGDQQVASLQTPSTASGAPTTSASGDSARPQLRLDSTPEEADRLVANYMTCLKDNGHVMLGPGAIHAGEASPPGSPPGVDMNDTSPASKAAEKACANKLPLQPPELEPKSNPKFNDDFVAMVKCMNTQGAQVHIAPDTSVDANGLTWQIDDGSSHTYDDLDKVFRTCQLQAFSGK